MMIVSTIHSSLSVSVLEIFGMKSLPAEVVDLGSVIASVCCVNNANFSCFSQVIASKS